MNNITEIKAPFFASESYRFFLVSIEYDLKEYILSSFYKNLVQTSEEFGEDYPLLIDMDSFSEQRFKYNLDAILFIFNSINSSYKNLSLRKFYNDHYLGTYYNVFSNGNSLYLIGCDFIVSYMTFTAETSLKASNKISENYLKKFKSPKVLYHYALLNLEENPSVSLTIYQYFEVYDKDILKNRLDQIRSYFPDDSKEVMMIELIMKYSKSDTEKTNEYKNKFKNSDYYNNLSKLNLHFNLVDQFIKNLNIALKLDSKNLNIKNNLINSYINSVDNDLLKENIFNYLHKHFSLDEYMYYLKLLCHSAIPNSFDEVLSCQNIQLSNNQTFNQVSNMVYFENIPKTGPFTNIFGLSNGLNKVKVHKVLNELESKVYYNVKNHIIINDLEYAENFNDSISESQSNNSIKIKIGFISSFTSFSYEALFMSGLIHFLPRNKFEISCYIENEEAADFSLVQSCDDIYIFPNNENSLIEQMNTKLLDVLVIGEFSSRYTKMLSLIRVAKYQILYNGLPETSASKNIDYFLSSLPLENPYYNRISSLDYPYTEQLILLDGQGLIVQDPVNYIKATKKLKEKFPINFPHREALGLSSSHFVFLIPQAMFKINPLFDLVIKKLLEENLEAHFVMLVDSKYPNLTNKFTKRIRETVTHNLSNRIHFIDRVDPWFYFDLIKDIADVVLQPFPLDDPLYSMNSIIASKPFITLPTEYLNGRRSYSFYRTMDISELVAFDILEYLSIANKLYSDPQFYNDCVSKISARKDLIFNDMLVPLSFTNFLLRLGSKSLITLDEFVSINAKSSKSKEEILKKMAQREENFKNFDKKIKKQSWMLNNNIPKLAHSLDQLEILPLFKSLYVKN